MRSLITRIVMPWLLVAGCGTIHSNEPMTSADHQRAAEHYEATARSILKDCWNARRSELTVADPRTCWKAQDQRFLDANLDAAAEHRAAAARARTAELERARASRTASVP